MPAPADTESWFCEQVFQRTGYRPIVNILWLDQSVLSWPSLSHELVSPTQALPQTQSNVASSRPAACRTLFHAIPTRQAPKTCAASTQIMPHLRQPVWCQDGSMSGLAVPCQSRPMSAYGRRPPRRLPWAVFDFVRLSDAYRHTWAI